jgi:hypothetical protein
MGYTRYWTIKSKIDKDRFFKFKETCEELVDLFKVPVDDLLINEDVVRFNGIGDDAHETFIFERTSIGFNFCKTQRKPYDELVCACLEVAKDVFKNEIGVSSDGDNNDDRDIRNKIKLLIRDKRLKDIL